MSNASAPDSWEQQADSGAADAVAANDMSAKFSTLNVNAAEFVPSFFSPSQSDSPTKSQGSDGQTPVQNGKFLQFLLSWHLNSRSSLRGRLGFQVMMSNVGYVEHTLT